MDQKWWNIEIWTSFMHQHCVWGRGEALFTPTSLYISNGEKSWKNLENGQIFCPGLCSGKLILLPLDNFLTPYHSIKGKVKKDYITNFQCFMKMPLHILTFQGLWGEGEGEKPENNSQAETSSDFHKIYNYLYIRGCRKIYAKYTHICYINIGWI